MKKLFDEDLSISEIKKLIRRAGQRDHGLVFYIMAISGVVIACCLVVLVVLKFINRYDGYENFDCCYDEYYDDEDDFYDDETDINSEAEQSEE